MLLSKCAVRDTKTSKFTKQQEVCGLLSSLGIKTSLGKIPLVGPFIEQMNTRYEMNEIVNRFLLAGDKFMPEMRLRRSVFTCSACGPVTKKKNLKKQEIHDIYQSELDKACFQHDMANWGFKDITRRGVASDQILRDKAFNIAKN